MTSTTITPPQTLSNFLNFAIKDGKLVATVLPQCPSISLWLLDPLFPQWDISNEQAAALMDAPPFWSFCWASGQVLAQYILNHPHIVANKTVVDFGAGSGVVAIAAKKAGAKSCTVCDSDPAALAAAAANAKMNNIELFFSDNLDSAESADIVTVADVFYDRNNIPLLDKLKQKYSILLVADSRLKGQPLEGLKVLSQHTSHTVPDLDESSEFNNVYVYMSDN